MCAAGWRAAGDTLRLPFQPTAVLGIVREIKGSLEESRRLLVGGAPGPAAELRRQLVRHGEGSAVLDVSGRVLSARDLRHADVLLYLVEGLAPTPADEEVLRLASRRRVHTVCVLIGAADPVPQVPYVLATDVIGVAAGQPPPFDRIAERIASGLGRRGHVLAARLPSLRPAIVRAIVKAFARENGAIGAAVFVPGADLPLLTLNQLRMVLRIAAAYEENLGRERALEILSVTGAAFGFRAIARQLAGLVPGPGWVYKGGVAYAGTRALGEAAIAYFETGVASSLSDAVRSRS
jgi:uncharacterized protein (DUF697 family)